MLDQERWNRIVWRCRRGMLENDLVLTRFLAARGRAMTEDEVALLDRLLDLPDSVSQETKDAVDAAKAGILDGTVTVDAIGDAAGVKTKLSELGYS